MRFLEQFWEQFDEPQAAAAGAHRGRGQRARGGQLPREWQAERRRGEHGGVSNLLTFRDGQGHSRPRFFDREEALEAAGLSE